MATRGSGVGEREVGNSSGSGGTEILVNVESPEVRVAEVRGGRLWGLDVDRGGRLLGDVFKGRVSNVVPGMDAAFVDIGLDHNALLYEGDVVRVGQHDGGSGHTRGALRAGEEVVVQVARPPVGSKGARVTMRLSLPGRYVVLSESADTVGVSRRLESEDERARLRRLAERLRPLDHGLVVRTEAEGATEAQLAGDVRALLALLSGIREQARAAAAPSRLHRDLGLVGRVVRDRMGEDVARVIVDEADTLAGMEAALRLVAPQLLGRLELHRGEVPLFKARGIEREVERAHSRTVALPSGGTLVIDEAEALTAIDVNTGRFTGRSRGKGTLGLAETVLATNLEAVEEAARQMRLREVGGVIAIDFIDMERTRDRVRVLDALEAALAQDRARTRIVALSPSGLVEITRRREGPSLRATLNRPCPYCSGRGVVKNPQTVALETRRRIREAAANERARRSRSAQAEVDDGPSPSSSEWMQVAMHPESACALLEGEGSHVRALEEECGVLLHITVDFGMHLEAARLSMGLAVGAGDHSSFDALASRLVVGERLSLPKSTPLYPAEEPCYTVVHGLLLRLEGPDLAIDASRASTQRAMLVEITRVGRWFATASAAQE